VLELLPWSANASPEAFLNPLDFHQDFNFYFVIAKKLEFFSKNSAKLVKLSLGKQDFPEFSQHFPTFWSKKATKSVGKKKSLVSILLLVCHMQYCTYCILVFFLNIFLDKVVNYLLLQSQGSSNFWTGFQLFTFTS
jgi:hypothetical protein